MQLSRQADYAVRAMVDLAALPEGGRATIAELARRQAMPAGFLKRIIPQLAAAGLLYTHRGERGGVALARSAETISLLEIVEAVAGPICLNRCLVRPGECSLDRRCAVHAVWMAAQHDLRQRLASARLADLAGPATAGLEAPAASEPQR